MRCCIVLLALLLFASPIDSQTRVDSPSSGSTVRKAILDGLRVPVENDLHQPVKFKVDVIKVQDGWAFVRGVPQRSDGSVVDYTGTKYKEAIDLGAFDEGFCALLRKEGKSWQVVTYAIGSTDVPWVTWAEEHKAPEAIFK